MAGPRSSFLHNKTALFIRTSFLFRPNVVVTAVPYLLGKAPRLRDLMAHDERLDPGMTGEISTIPIPGSPVGA